MEINSLKNIGKSLSDISTSLPKEQQKEISTLSTNIIRKELSLISFIRFVIFTIFETKKCPRQISVKYAKED